MRGSLTQEKESNQRGGRGAESKPDRLILPQRTMPKEKAVDEAFRALERAVELDKGEVGCTKNVAEVIKSYSRAVLLFEEVLKDEKEEQVCNLLSDKVLEQPGP